MSKDEKVTEEDIQHPNFQWILTETEAIIPRMNADELTDIVIAMFNNELLQQQNINDKIIDALMPKVHELAFNRMLTLESNTKNSNSLQSIHLKIEEIFLKNVECFLADEKIQILTFVNIANYMERHIEIVSMNIIEAFSSALIRANEKPLNIHVPVSIILVYSKFGELGAQSENALKEMVRLWIQFSPTLGDVENLLFHLSANRAKQDKQAFEESGIIQFSLTFLSEKCNGIVLSLKCYEHLMRMVFFKAIVVVE